MKVSRGLIGLSLIIGFAIFVFDLMTPKGVAAAVPYVGLVLLSRRSQYPPFAFILAALATSLTILGYFLSPDGSVRMDLANRGLGIFATWLTAVLCYQHIEMVLRLDTANESLKRQVLDTVSETVQAVSELQSEREDRKLAEEELQDVEERFTAIFNQTFQLIAVLDRNGKIDAANDTFMMACGQRRHETQGQPIWSLHSLAHNPVYQDRLRRAVDAAAHGNFSRVEMGFTDANGMELTMDASVKPIRDSDSEIYSLIFEARDITEEKQNQELLHQAQKTEVIGQLTSGVAHDFNNILAIIAGHLELSNGPAQSEEKRQKHRESALEAVFRARDLTQQLLSFSRKRRLERRSVEVRSLVDDALKLVDRTLLKEIEITTDLASPTWTVLSDTGELQTALINLIVNSRDAMPDGGTVTIKTTNHKLFRNTQLLGVTLEPGDYVLLSVTDEGTGIAPEYLDRITEPYFTTKAHGAGTGLGLSMVNQFVRQCGGGMHIASTVGVGTTVTLYLPRSCEEAAGPDLAMAAEPATNVDASENILVVEDDPDLRRNVATMLRDIGYTVAEAGDGATALAMLRDGSDFDLVFSDIALPGEYDGRDLAEEISKLDREVKVLLTTGVPDHVRDGALEKDGVPVLAKPYRHKELAASIRSILSA